MRIGLGVICVVLALAGCKDKDKDAAKATLAPIDKPAPVVEIDAQVKEAVVAKVDAQVEPARPASITDKLLADGDASVDRLAQIATDVEAAPDCTKALAAYRADIKKFHKADKAWSAEAAKLDDASQRWLYDHLGQEPGHARFSHALVK